MTRNFILSIFIALGLTITATAQQTKTFEDTYGIKGTYTYSGIFSDSLLPQQGPVDIKWREIEGSGITTYRARGRTARHQPEGNWIWEEARWGYNITVGTGIQPVFNTMGKRMKWEGSFANGIPHGKWIFTLDSITPGDKVLKKLLRVELTYRNGVPAGPVLYENHERNSPLKVTGTTDANGIATGTWLYAYTGEDGRPAREERTYKNGLLTSITTHRGNEKTIAVLQEQPENTRTGTMIFASDGHPALHTLRMDRELNAYFLNGWKLDLFPYTFNRALPGYRKPEYPLSEDEKEQITAGRQLVADQQESIRHHLAGNINIHRSRSGTLDTSIAYLQLYDQRLQYTDSLLKRTADPLFTYKNRSEQGLQHWVDGLNSMTYARGEIYDSLEVHLHAFRLVNRQNVFADIRNMLEQDGRKLPAYFKVVEEDRQALDREGTLRKLEDAMAARLEVLQDSYAGKDGIGGEIYQKWIKGDIQELLQHYARSDNYDTALHIGHTIMTRMDSLERWTHRTAAFDSMPRLLRQQYTYLAYNPYTGVNDIEITHKRRFITNILVNMWPYMDQEMQQEQDWHTWSALWNRRFQVYHYLVDFVSQEDRQARKLEQRIRSERKPDKMIRLLTHQAEHP